MIDNEQLVNELLSEELIEQKRLEKGLEVAKQQGVPLYEVVIHNDLVDEPEVVEIASEILNVPCVHLGEDPPPPETARLIPREIADSKRAIPLEMIDEEDEQVLRLAMTDPIDVLAMDEIADHVGVDIQPVLAGPAALQRAIGELYDDGDDSAIELTDDDAIELDDGDDSAIELTDDDAIELDDSDDDVFELDDSDDAIELDDSDDDVFELDDSDDDVFELDDDEELELDDDSDDDVFELDDDEELELDDGGDGSPLDDSTPFGLGDDSAVDDSDRDSAASPDDGDDSRDDEDDSWAAMFDEVEESEADEDDGSPSGPSRPSPPVPGDSDGADAPDSGPVSREMRDRPPTGVLEVVADEDDEPAPSNPAFSQHPAAVSDSNSTTGTQVGTPGELGDWELDEALEKSGAARLGSQSDSDSSNSSSDANSNNQTQVGAPVEPDQWDLDDDYYEDDASDSSPSDRTQMGVATQDEAPSSPPPEDDAPDDDDGTDPSGSPRIEVDPELEEPTDDGDSEPPPPDSDDASDPPTGDRDSTEDDDSGGRPAPDSLRSKLNRAKNKKDDATDGDADSLPPPPESKTGDDGDDEADEPAALGKIDVKKKRVPSSSFKGAIEKRSDRQDDDRSDSSSGADETDSADDDGDTTETGGVEIPADADSQRLLSGLIELLVDREVLAAEDVQELIDEMG